MQGQGGTGPTSPTMDPNSTTSPTVNPPGGTPGSNPSTDSNTTGGGSISGPGGSMGGSDTGTGGAGGVHEFRLDVRRNDGASPGAPSPRSITTWFIIARIMSSTTRPHLARTAAWVPRAPARWAPPVRPLRQAAIEAIRQEPHRTKQLIIYSRAGVEARRLFFIVRNSQSAARVLFMRSPARTRSSELLGHHRRTGMRSTSILLGGAALALAGAVATRPSRIRTIATRQAACIRRQRPLNVSKRRSGISSSLRRTRQIATWPGLTIRVTTAP